MAKMSKKRLNTLREDMWDTVHNLQTIARYFKEEDPVHEHLINAMMQTQDAISYIVSYINDKVKKDDARADVS